MGRGRSPWWKEEEGKWKKSEKKRLSEGRREWNVRRRWRENREKLPWRLMRRDLPV